MPDVVREDLVQAAALGFIDMVRCLLLAGMDVNERLHRFKGITALMLACRHGHADVVTLLIDFGAHIEAWDSDGDSAMTAAIRNGDVDIVRLLIGHANCVNSLHRCNVSPLMMASSAGHSGIVRLLLCYAGLVLSQSVSMMMATWQGPLLC